MTSASPRRIISAASPRAWPAEAQALVVEKLGPIAPKVMAATPEGMLAMAMGMKKGLRRVAPFAADRVICSMSVPVPPSPEAIRMPVSSASSPSRRAGSAASASASWVATRAICVVRSLRRTSFRSRTLLGSKSGTSPPMRLGSPEASKLP